MYAWSKSASCRALAVALVATLWGFGVTAMQAKDHKDQSCQKTQGGCPAPVLQKPAPIEQSCCPMPAVQHRCGPPVQTGCCPVDPKDVSKAEKEALHAQHEAAEACKKQQKAIAKANHEIDEEYARQQSKIDKANAHLNHEVSELQDANAKYEAFFGGPSEATAEVTPQPEPVIIRSKPEEPIAETRPQPEPEQQVVILETPPAPVTEPAPAPAPEPVEKPKQLPRTASPFSLIGLIGLLSMSGYATRFFRR
jgi:hypothetical protein